LGSEDAGSVPLEALKNCSITHILIPAYTGNVAVLYPEDIIYMHLNLRDVSGISLVVVNSLLINC
jgi:hypothetical protein